MIFLQFVIILQIDIPPPLLSFISKISKEEYFPGKIACLSHLVAIENIKKKLTEPQLEMFRKSCFGHFLLFPKLRFLAQIIHQLLLRQCETKKDNEIWILLKSKGLRFSKEEFALITGLSFGPITKCDKKSLRIRDTYFKGENKVRNDELEKVFLSLGEEKKKKKKIEDGLSMARNRTNSNYQRMTFLLIMPMVCNLFILSNGLMLTLCISPSMFGLVTRY